MISQEVRLSHRPLRSGLRRYAAVLALGPALAACSGWPYSAGNPKSLATYDAPVRSTDQDAQYRSPMRGNYLVEDWNLGREQRAAAANQPTLVASAAGTHIPTSFLQALDSDYASYATSLDSRQHQWADADYFARKGLAASRTQYVMPEDSRNWLISGDFRPMLSAARVRLVSDLNNGGRDNAPALAARAQVSYDCWVERSEVAWWNAASNGCRTQFETALNQLERRAPPAATAEAPTAKYQYQVYFDFDKFSLTSEAHQVVTSVAERLRSDPGLRIALVGKADRAGTDPYNMRLSERRAATVRAELVMDGVAANHIVARWVGEREPPVPTPDGVREARNRVVEVALSDPNQEVSQR
jgi:OOP family OmpA-OmpF porin